MEKKVMRALTVMLVLGLVTNAFAGTGGSEVASWYTDISASLKGSWGKIIAVVFIGIAIILFKSGAVIGGLFMVMLGLSIGMIPDIVDSKYTALASMQDSTTGVQMYLEQLQSLLTSTVLGN